MPKISKSTKQTKSRTWAFVAYPDSLPKDWLGILRQSGLKIAISPLHDKDTDPDEKEKKPHYHIIAVWDNGSTTYNNALNLAKKVKGTIPIALESIRGYYRYFTHQDNPEKYQYDKKDIVHLNGFDIGDFVELTKSEINNLKREVFKLIQDNDFTEYDDLLIFLFETNEELWNIAVNHTIFFNAVLKSRRHKNENKIGRL